jgi:hypothetical protein
MCRWTARSGGPVARELMLGRDLERDAIAALAPAADGVRATAPRVPHRGGARICGAHGGRPPARRTPCTAATEIGGAIDA